VVNIIGLWSGRLVRDALQVTTSFGIIIPLVGDLLMIAKGNVKIGIEWRFGADWPGQRCGAKTRKGTACQRPANKKNGRCRLLGNFLDIEIS